MNETYFTVGDSNGPWYGRQCGSDHCFEAADEAREELLLI